MGHGRLRLRVLERLLRGGQFGLRLAQRAVGLGDGAVEVGVLDGHEDVALVDRLAGDDVDGFDLTGDLRRDDGGGQGLQGALGVDHRRESAEHGDVGDGLHDLLGLLVEGGDGHRAADHDGGGDARRDGAVDDLLAAALRALGFEGGVRLGI